MFDAPERYFFRGGVSLADQDCEITVYAVRYAVTNLSLRVIHSSSLNFLLRKGQDLDLLFVFFTPLASLFFVETYSRLLLDPAQVNLVPK